MNTHPRSLCTIWDCHLQPTELAGLCCKLKENTFYVRSWFYKVLKVYTFRTILTPPADLPPNKRMLLSPLLYDMLRKLQTNKAGENKKTLFFSVCLPWKYKHVLFFVSLQPSIFGTVASSPSPDFCYAANHQRKVEKAVSAIYNYSLKYVCTTRVQRGPNNFRNCIYQGTCGETETVNYGFKFLNISGYPE